MTATTQDLAQVRAEIADACKGSAAITAEDIERAAEVVVSHSGHWRDYRFAPSGFRAARVSYAQHALWALADARDAQSIRAGERAA